RVSWFSLNCSAGMIKKVMIMFALFIGSELYVVDGPLVGLDPLSIQSYLQLMEKIKKKGAGVLMSTHILATAERYCDRFVILHEGKTRAIGTLDRLREQFDMPGAARDDLYIELSKEDGHG